MLRKIPFIKSKNSKDTPKLNLNNALDSINNINNINQLPSFDRFKELLSKLEYEYKILWLENQELKSKVEYLSNNNNNKNSSGINNSGINNNVNNSSSNSNSNNNNQQSTNNLNNSSNNVIVNNNNNNNNSSTNNSKNKSSNSPNISHSSKTNIPIITPILNKNSTTVNNTTSTTAIIPPNVSSSSTIPLKSNSVTTAVNNTTSSSTTSKINSGFLISSTGKAKLPKIKKSKPKSKPIKQSSLSKRDGSHKWIRAKEYLGHRDGIWEIQGCPWEILYFGTASTDRTARIWCVDGSKLPIVYTGHTGAVNSIRFHPFERYFCTASGDKTIHIVKVPSDRSSHGYRSPLPHHQQPLINIQQPQYTSPNQIISHNIPPGSPVMGKSSKVNNNQNNNNNYNNNIPITNIQNNIDKSKNKLWTPLLQSNSLINSNNSNNINSSGGIPIPNNNNNNNNSTFKNKNNDEENDFDMDSESSDMEQNISQSLPQPVIQTFKIPQSPRDFKILNDDNRIPIVQTFQQHQNQQYQQASHHQQQIQRHNHSHHHKKSNQLHTNAEQTHSFIRSSVMELKGHSSPVIAAAWVTPTVIASSSWDNSIRWWNTETGRMISNSNICRDQLYRVTNITTQPLANIQCLTSSTDGIIRIWDFRSSTPSNCIGSIQASSESINTAVFTNDGNSIVSGGDDKSVKVWDVRQSKTYKTSIRCPFNINRLSVSTHGSIAIPQDDGRVSVYDIYGNRKGKMRDQYKYGHKLMCTSTSWSFDDSVIFSCSIDRKSIVWAENS